LNSPFDTSIERRQVSISQRISKLGYFKSIAHEHATQMAARQRKQQQQQQQQQQSSSQEVDNEPKPSSPSAKAFTQHITGSLSLQPLGLLCTGTTLMVLGQFINMQVSACGLPCLLSCIV
jgi:hypothetical protein